MSSFGTGPAFTLYGEIAVPSAPAIQGMQEVRAEAEKTAAAMTVAGQKAGRGFNAGLLDSVGRGARALNKVITGLFVAPAIVAGAYKLGEAIGDSIASGIESKYFRLKDHIDKIGKDLEKTEAQMFAEGRKRMIEKGQVPPDENIDFLIEDQNRRLKKDQSRLKQLEDMLIESEQTDRSGQGNVNLGILPRAQIKETIDFVRRAIIETSKIINDLESKRGKAIEAGSPSSVVADAIAKAVKEAIKEAMKDQNDQLLDQVTRLVQGVGDISRVQNLLRSDP